jgi:hypothetical protein
MGCRSSRRRDHQWIRRERRGFARRSQELVSDTYSTSRGLVLDIADTTGSREKYHAEHLRDGVIMCTSRDGTFFNVPAQHATQTCMGAERMVDLQRDSNVNLHNSGIDAHQTLAKVGVLLQPHRHEL